MKYIIRLRKLLKPIFNGTPPGEISLSPRAPIRSTKALLYKPKSRPFLQK
ncbi:hypothetical protein HanRHA438_Chr07g0301561 [Helianthus annuus]|nr:hypothetical protein HanRHA438_Chr07g0301561 [Helianthus annuus]